MVLIGIIASIFAAIGQALNYALTKDCQEKHRIYGFRMLIGAHIGMGFIMLWPFLFCSYYTYFEWEHLIDLFKINLPFLFAQYCMMQSIRVSDASIVSPLLVLKIPVLAAISIVLFKDSYAVHQYLAIAAILLLSWYFSSLSGQIKLKALMFVFLASFCYVLSDIAITDYAKKFAAHPIEQVMIANSFNYIAGAIFFLPCAFMKKVTAKDIYNCKYVALSWIIAVTLIVIGFNLSGLVSGTIIQSLRGAFGIIIALIFFRNEIMDHGARWQLKVAISILMTLSVASFYL